MSKPAKFKSSNVAPIINNDIKNRYEQAYQLLLKKLHPDLLVRVEALKTEPNSRDYEANKFIREVIALAESDVEIA